MAMTMRINKLNAHIRVIKMLDTTIAVGKPSCYCTKVHSIMFRKSMHKVMKIGKKFDSVVIRLTRSFHFANLPSLFQDRQEILKFKHSSAEFTQ